MNILGIGLQKLRHELLTMDDDCDKDIDNGDVGSANSLVLNSQVLSNITFMLQDPVHVPCRGQSKSLRQKHPKEKQAASTRTCSIYKKTGHVKSNCPSHKQARYSYNFFLGKIYISPPNYHPFSGWHPELPTLALRPPKLPLSDFLAPSVYLYR
jgi:hypothetical protein